MSRSKTEALTSDPAILRSIGLNLLAFSVCSVNLGPHKGGVSEELNNRMPFDSYLWCRRPAVGVKKAVRWVLRVNLLNWLPGP